jgi:hypothetical protein
MDAKEIVRIGGGQIGSGSCPLDDAGICCFETFGSVTTMLLFNELQFGVD